MLGMLKGNLVNCVTDALCNTCLSPSLFFIKCCCCVAVKPYSLCRAFILTSCWHFSLTSGQQLTEAWHKCKTASGLWMKEMAWKTIGWKRGFLGQSVWPVKGLLGNKMLFALCHSLLLLSLACGGKGEKANSFSHHCHSHCSIENFHGYAREHRGVTLNSVSISFLKHHYEKMFSV